MSKDKYPVLVVDDFAFLRNSVCKIIEKMGCAADAVASGQEALNQLKDNSYALIFMDCRMPGMDGYETTRAVRAGGDNTPIVGLTAIASAKDRERGLNSGMNELIDRSLVSNKLGDLMKRYPAHDD